MHASSLPFDTALGAEPEPSAAPATRAARSAATPGLTASLLARDLALPLPAHGARFATGLGFAAVFGLALGASRGGASFLTHALGAPLVVLGVAALGAPALFIVLALFDAPVAPRLVAAAAARAAAGAGIVLAGLAPAVALHVVTLADFPLELVALASLSLAGCLGLRLFLDDLGLAFAGAPQRVRAAAAVIFAGFVVFAIALGLRIGWATLPLLRGQW